MDKAILQQARSGAVYFELVGQALYEASGEDQLEFLNGQLTNDVRPATASQAVYATICSVKGMLEGDCFVFRHPASGDFRVSTGPALAESLLFRFDRFIIADDVLFDDLTEGWRQLHVAGPGAEAAIAKFPVAAPAQWLRTDRLGMPGYDLVAPAREYGALRAQIAATLPELTQEAAERLRIENGRPAWGHEIVRDTLPQEAGLEALAISFHKGCYIGQEIVSRVKSAGKLRRQIRGFSAEPGAEIEPGACLLAGPEEGAATVGSVTSVAQGFPGEAVFGLASVKSGHENAGHQLWVAGREGLPPVPVRVESLPFPAAQTSV